MPALLFFDEDIFASLMSVGKSSLSLLSMCWVLDGLAPIRPDLTLCSTELRGSFGFAEVESPLDFLEVHNGAIVSSVASQRVH